MSRSLYCELRPFLLFKYGISVAFNAFNHGSLAIQLNYGVSHKPIGLKAHSQSREFTLVVARMPDCYLHRLNYSLLEIGG